MENHYQLAQINIARMRGVSINDPIMKEFVDNLDKVNQLAEQSEGFIWRLKDETNDATSFNPYNDEQVIVNISVWESIETLEKFVYRTFHTNFLRRRKEWFLKYGKASNAMWWINKGDYPTVQNAVALLDYLQINGASEKVFDFKNKFSSPNP
ncbi:DUF3291 domain-containing protein [uncultured Maribacter sp.]|uniref:DUF3291 domain-containing protein n=1 Tax=uncultured Maribacter sp. TaxID=431308 RepID=UPI0026243242|nr:DUF3291 domain-containing protein [uncultured Maribacter sp.]